MPGASPRAPAASDGSPARRLSTGASLNATGSAAAASRAGRISVACRVRPLLDGEVSKGVQRAPWVLTDRSVSLKLGAIGRASSSDRGRPPSADVREGHNGTLGKTRSELRNVDHLRRSDGETIMDAVFGESSTTQEVYEKSFRGIVANAAEGLNGAIMAYGQTSSGKTYSISGASAKRPSSEDGEEGEAQHKGIIHFALDDMFAQIREQAKATADSGRGVEFLVRMSYAELYMERVNDLLRKISPQSQNLAVKEDPETKSFYVEGLKEKIVSSAEEVVEVLAQAEKRRRVAHTRFNEVSSRSHTILTLCVERSSPLEASPEEGGSADDGGEEARLTQVGRLVIVDLAGNERMEMGTEYMAESNSINTSLFFLGKVIEKLSAQARQARGEDAEAAGAHVPLRDSKLTRLLSVHLGGNSQTGILVTMTPAEDAIEQSLTTLRFAQKAGQVRCSAKPVLVSKEQSLIIKQREIISQLQKQVQAMKEQERLSTAHGRPDGSPQRSSQDARESAAREEDDAGAAAQLARERAERAEQLQALTVGGSPGQQTVVSRSREVDAIVTALHRNNDALRKQKETVLGEIKRMYTAVTDTTKRAGRAATELKPGGGGLEVAAESLGGCPGPPAQGQASAWAPALEELRSQMQALVRLAYTRAQSDSAASCTSSAAAPADDGSLRTLREENSQLRSSVQFLAGERKRLKEEAARLQQQAAELQDSQPAGKRSDDGDGSRCSPKSSAAGKIGTDVADSAPALAGEMPEVEEPEVEKSGEWSDSWAETSKPAASHPAAQSAVGLTPTFGQEQSVGRRPIGTPGPAASVAAAKQANASAAQDSIMNFSGTLGDFEPIVERAADSRPTDRLTAGASSLGDFEPIVERNAPPTPPAPLRRPPSPKRQDPLHGLSPACFRPPADGGVPAAARSPMRLPTLGDKIGDKLGDLCLDRPGVGRPPSGRSTSLPGRAASPTLAPLREGGRTGTASSRPSSRGTSSRSPSRALPLRPLVAS